MWRKLNTACLAGLIAVLGVAAAAPAQHPPTPTPGAAGTDPPKTAPLLDITHALQAHLLATQWLHEGVTPPPELVRPIPVTGLIGAAITLRVDGITLGFGQAMLPPDADPTRPADLARLLRDATRQAIDAMTRSLDEAAARARPTPVADASVMPRPTVRQMAANVALDVQLAGDPRRIVLPADAPTDALLSRFAPGYHGLRLIDPASGLHTMTWPATALAMNVSPASQLLQMLVKLNLDSGAMSDLARPDGLTLQRLRVHHVAPPRSQQPPFPLTRGAVTLPARTIDAESLDDMATRLADHLDGLFLSDGRLRGTYHATTGRYDPELADPDEALLVAYALTRHVRQERQRRPDDPRLLALNHRAQVLADGILATLQDQPTERSPAHAALALLTAADNSVAPRNTDLRDRMIDLLRAACRPDGSFAAPDPSDATPANQTVSAIAVAGLAAAYEQTRRDDLLGPLNASLDRLWQESDRRPNVNALPWLAMAHERTASLADHDAQPDRRAQRDRSLAELIGQILLRQIVDQPTDGPDDVIGGFDLGTPSPDRLPDPDWTTAQLLMFLSIAARQPSIRAGQDDLGWVLGAGLAARFLHQLQIRPSDGFAMPDPRAAIGGVRATMWNYALPPRAGAMTLLAVTELRQMIQALEKQ